MTHGAKSFGAALWRYRTAAGLSQEELAERAELSRRGISDLERGVHRAPYPATLRRLADALGLSDSQRAAFFVATRSPGTDATPADLVLAPLTSFIGREREVAELRRLLGTCRLLTLTGAGGVGKTRLALHVVRELRATHPGGSAIVELAALADPALVAQAVAAAVGVPEQPGGAWPEVLSRALQPRQLVLVLDNCEHLIAACAELAERLLRSCPELRILATSREGLSVSGETTWRVPSLSVPDPQLALTLRQMARSEAVQLFVERAASAWPGFSLTQDNAAAIAQLCRRLDGIPLAIELAAARVGLLSVEQIGERLDDALRLLVSGSRIAPPRQQTLRATLEWSYGLLDGVERRLFGHLSVFAGGWTLEAAEAVCTDDSLPAKGILEVLGRLVDKSLVVCEPGADGRVRYRLLDMLRQLAAERLAAAGETSHRRDRHLDWFAAMAERNAAQLSTPRQARCFDWFRQELDNLRSALDWALQTGRATAGLRIAAAMRRFWFHGYQSEGQANLRALLTLPDASAHPAARAAALVALGVLTRERGDLPQARAYGEQAVDLAREAGEAGGLFEALISLGWTVAFQSDWSTAERLFREAHGVAAQAGPWELASAVMWLGQLRALQRDDANARPLLEHAVTQLRDLGDSERLAQSLCVLADIALRQDRPGEAYGYAREALELSQQLGQTLAWTARALDLMVRLAAAHHQPERAVRLAAAVSTIHPHLGPLLSRMSRQEAVELARRQLGTTKAATVWAEGQAMTRQEAVALALSADGDPRPARARAHLTRGSGPLTPREREVAQLVRCGLTNRQIGQALVITEGTAALHVKKALSKLGFTSRAQLAVWATQRPDLLVTRPLLDDGRVVIANAFQIP